MYIQTDVFGTYTLPYTYIQTGMFGTYTLPYTYIQTGVFFTYTLPYRYIQTDVFGTYIYTLLMYIPHSIHVYIPHSRRVWYIYIYLTYVYTSLYTWLHLISVSSITYVSHISFWRLTASHLECHDTHDGVQARSEGRLVQYGGILSHVCRVSCQKM